MKAVAGLPRVCLTPFPHPHKPTGAFQRVHDLPCSPVYWDLSSLGGPRKHMKGIRAVRGQGVHTNTWMGAEVEWTGGLRPLGRS